MKRVLNYDDDIFFLTLEVKAAHDGIKLDIDTQFFIKKIAQDLIYFSSVIDQLYASLFEFKTMLKRKEYLKNLSRLKNNFVSLLDDIIQVRYPVASELGVHKERFTAIKAAQEKSLEEIRNLLEKSHSAAGHEGEHIVSEEEIKQLLSVTEEESGVSI